MSNEERRAPGATRIPFEGLVEVGGAAGPTFEAQAVNVSEEGIQVRSAYLPEPGQPLTCRFDMGAGQSVLAAGEVAWARGAERGGELGIRFTDMDPESIDALKRVCGTAADGQPAAAASGAKVRLHIDGLASPMRAKIRDSRTNEITVGSDLGFLQVGKELHLEDPQSGARRPASIDTVEVVVDPASHVPQLVVTLRYTDVSPAGGAVSAPGPCEVAAAPPAAEGQRAGDLAAVEEASMRMKGTIARNAARLGPALERFAHQAKTTIALLAKRGRERVGGETTSQRRTTAPAPGGGLHTSGRRVVRGETAASSGEESGQPKLKMTRRKAAVASAVMVAAILGAIAIKKTHGEGASAAGGAAAAASEVTAATTVTAAVAAANPPPAPPAPASPPEPVAAFGSVSSSPGATSGADDDSDGDSRAAHKKRIHVAPFGNGPVHHGTILRLKMDGPIEALEGAQQPTGFAVKVPGRKSLEAAGPLAARDSRIAAIKVSNETAGADLTVAFKDGVPNYQVTARGDTLVIALATPGALEKTVAKKDEGGGNGPKRAKPTQESQKSLLRAQEHLIR